MKSNPKARQQELIKLLQEVQKGDYSLLQKIPSFLSVQASFKHKVAMAQIISNSYIFQTLQKSFAKEGNNYSKEMIETSKLIQLICSLKFNLVDVINQKGAIIQRLLEIYSKEQITPTPNQLINVVKFFHAVSLQDGTIRNQKLRGPLQSFLVNIFSKNYFFEFTQQQNSFQMFIKELIKFHRSVPNVTKYIYHSLMRVLEDINQEYKALAKDLNNVIANKGASDKFSIFRKRVIYADNKLTLIIKLYELSNGDFFKRLTVLEMKGLMSKLIQILILQPILMTQPQKNQPFCHMIMGIYRIILNATQPLIEKQEQQIDRQIQHLCYRGLQEQQIILLSQSNSSDSEQLQEHIVTQKFSDKYYYQIIESTIQTLVTAFKLQKENDIEGNQATKFNDLLIEIFTMRLKRMLSLIIELFSPEELKKKGAYYQNILKQLYDLLPYYFKLSLNSQIKFLKTQLPKFTDITGESDISLTHYIFHRLDEQSIKKCIQTMLDNNINPFAIYQAAAKFGYYSATCQKSLQYIAVTFIHKFIAYLQKQYLADIIQSGILTLQNIQCLRIIIQFISGHENQSNKDNKHKKYWYCRIAEKQRHNNIFELLANILNLVERHNPESTTDLVDTIQNREEVVKTIFTKLILQRIRTFVTSFTATIRIKRSFTNNYISFLNCMMRLIKDIARSPYGVSHKEDVMVILINNIFVSSIEFDLDEIEEIKINQNECKYQIKYTINQVSLQLFDWILSNLNSNINQLSLIIKKMLHFNKMEVSIVNRQLEMNQEQNHFIQQFFIRNISDIINQSYFKFTHRNLYKGGLTKCKRNNYQGFNLHGEVSKLANFFAIMSQFAALQIHQTFEFIDHFSITDNFIISLIDYATYLLSKFPTKLCFADEANALICNSLRFVTNYLYYKENRMEYQRKKRRMLNKYKNKRARQRKRNAKMEEEEKNRKQPFYSYELDANKSSIVNPKRTEIQTIKDIDKTDKDQSKIVHKRQTKKNKQMRILKARVQIYLKKILLLANKSNRPLLSSTTLQQYLEFISQNLKVNILNIPSHKDFEINFCDILEELVKIKVTNTKTIDYDLILAKIGIKMLNEDHVSVDYQMGIKQYLFQKIKVMDQDIELSEFIQFLKQHFHKMTNISHLIEIVGLQLNIRLPFIEENYSKLISDGQGKNYKIMPKQGVQLQLLNIKIDSQSMRKLSNNMQGQEKDDKDKFIKIADYLAEGEIHFFVKTLIKHLKVNNPLLLNKGACKKFIDNYFNPKAVVQPFNTKVITQTLLLLKRKSPSLASFINEENAKSKLNCK